MAQPISTLPQITAVQITDNDSFVVTDVEDADSSKRLLFSDLFAAIVSLTNNNSDSAQPGMVKVWTGSRTTYDTLSPDSDVLYFTQDGGVFLGSNTIVDPTLTNVFEGATGGTFSGYTLRVVDANQIPVNPDANTIYFERVSTS